MNDALRVRMVHGPGQQHQELCRLLRGQRSAGQPACQGAAFRILHCKKGPAAQLAHFINLHDVGVVKASRSLDFDEETLPFLLSRQWTRQDHLEGDQPPELDLPRLVDDPHAATT